MADDKVRLTLHGLASEDGHVRLADFLRELQLFSGTLKKFDRFVSAGRLSCYYRVVDLSHSSPATVVVEGQPRRRGELGAPYQVIGEFLATLNHIQRNGQVPKPLNLSILRGLKRMMEPLGRSISSVEIGGNGIAVPLTRDFETLIDHLLQPEEEYPGSISGMLDAINFHGGANVFYLYPDIGPEKIACHFPSEMSNRAAAAINQFVTVNGLLRRKVNAPFPHIAFVDSIEVMPPDSELPSLRDLRGIAPDLTGELLSEDFVRELRHADAIQ
jgi:hypothetical protein